MKELQRLNVNDYNCQQTEQIQYLGSERMFTQAFVDCTHN